MSFRPVPRVAGALVVEPEVRPDPVELWCEPDVRPVRVESPVVEPVARPDRLESLYSLPEVRPVREESPVVDPTARSEPARPCPVVELLPKVLLVGLV